VHAPRFSDTSSEFERGMVRERVNAGLAQAVQKPRVIHERRRDMTNDKPKTRADWLEAFAARLREMRDRKINQGRGDDTVQLSPRIADELVKALLDVAPVVRLYDEEYQHDRRSRGAGQSLRRRQGRRRTLP
jgi:hypothetical protein